MNLSITGHHIEITPALRGYVETKLERVLRRFDQIIDANVVLTLEKLRQRAEATIRVRGKEINVVGDEEDMYAAIDSMVDKLDRQVLKYKDRVYAHDRDSLKYREAEQ